MAVDFALSDDQEAIADAFGSFFTNECPPDAVRAAEPLGHSPELWAKLQSMEAPGMAASVDAGGSGADLSALLVVAEALGAAAAPVPLIEHWVSSRLLAGAEGFDAVVSGDDIATIALRPASNGNWAVVPAGAIANVVIGVAGDSLVAVRNDAPGASPHNHAAAPIADRSVEGQRIELGPAAMLDAALDQWRTLTAGALVGIAQRALDIGVQYMLEREQFGKLIGSFQGLQHGIADAPALIDGARFVAHKAAWAHDSGLVGGAGLVDPDDGYVTEFAPLASMALLHASEAAAHVTDTSLHYHGGYGFSLEYDIQLYYRRARGWSLVAGDPATERLRLADLLWPQSNEVRGAA